MWTIFFVSFLTSLIAMKPLFYFLEINKVYDIPNHRSVHKNKILRMGGLLFLIGYLLYYAWQRLLMNLKTYDAAKSEKFLIFLVFTSYLVLSWSERRALDCKNAQRSIPSTEIPSISWFWAMDGIFSWKFRSFRKYHSLFWRVLML